VRIRESEEKNYIIIILLEKHRFKVGRYILSRCIENSDRRKYFSDIIYIPTPSSFIVLSSIYN